MHLRIYTGKSQTVAHQVLRLRLEDPIRIPHQGWESLCLSRKNLSYFGCWLTFLPAHPDLHLCLSKLPFSVFSLFIFLHQFCGLYLRVESFCHVVIYILLMYMCVCEHLWKWFYQYTDKIIFKGVPLFYDLITA